MKDTGLKNAPSARVFPAATDHRALAVYWGEEATSSVRAILTGTSTFPLDDDHAWRCAKIAAYHWARWRGYRKEQF